MITARNVRLAGGIAALLCCVCCAAAAQETSQSTAPSELSASQAAALLEKHGSRGVRVHDPSTIVEEDGEYWLFVTGRGTPSYRSKDLTNWTAGPRTFETPPAWAAEAVPDNRGGLDFWAPDAIRLKDRYFLYYSVSTFGRNRSAIGLATNATLNPDNPKYRWEDGGIVVQSDRTNNFNAIDPAVTTDQAGNLWMSFGSFWSGIKMIQLDPATGKRITPDSPMHSLANYEKIEAPFIYHHGSHYYLFVNWGVCCRGTNSTYEIRVGRSETITGPYLDKEGGDMLAGGGSLFLATDGPFIGPGHAGILRKGDEYWLSLHYYDGAQRGRSALATRRMRWNADGWPEAL